MATRMHELAHRRDPTSLRGLGQAVFIAKCLCKGVKEDQIIKLFHGDKQLVEMWLNFLRHNRWVEYSLRTDRWSLTVKGREKVTGIIPT